LSKTGKREGEEKGGVHKTQQWGGRRKLMKLAIKGNTLTHTSSEKGETEGDCPDRRETNVSIRFK